MNGKTLLNAYHSDIKKFILGDYMSRDCKSLTDVKKSIYFLCFVTYILKIKSYMSLLRDFTIRDE